MSLENWVKNSWLEKRDSDAAEITRLLAIADGRLKDYQGAVAARLSSDVQLDLGYDAIRACATAALRAAGYRVVRGGNDSSFPSIRRRNSFLSSISCAKSGISARTTTSG